MKALASALTLFVAFEHTVFLVLEMFYWTKPLGRRVFGLTPELAESSRALAMNQGLYNGFLAVGLVWGVVEGEAGWVLRVFFLSCVVVAGVFGGVTAKRSILFIQGLPAAIALTLTILNR